ncbi:MAG TPA: lysophospholipid acyltransferase family protein [Candidatus Eremiobacteraceae bacterium]|nr:lysophospholipid acyltransferase family protein [Candidatus Eremiobacteraceae bacterium]
MSFYDFCKTLLRPLTRLLYDARISGLENVPLTGPLVVAANHRSYLDPPLLGAWFPRTIHYMAKKELFAISWLGPILRNVHSFPVNREIADPGAIKHALKVLRAGEVVGIFPEGTRNIDGAARARSGAVLLAATAKCPILPVALLHTEQAFRRFRAVPVEIRIGVPLVFQGTERKATKAELERWTLDLAAAIERLMPEQHDGNT